jgi:hypothetical protein
VLARVQAIRGSVEFAEQARHKRFRLPRTRTRSLDIPVRAQTGDVRVIAPTSSEGPKRKLLKTNFVERLRRRA